MDEPTRPISRYLALLSASDTSRSQLADLLAEDAVLVEHPNLLLRTRRERTRSQMLDGFEAGRTLLSSQRYEATDYIVQPAPDGAFRVACTGTTTFSLAIALAEWPAGTTFRADMAMFFEIRDDKITRQEQFDTYYAPVLPPVETTIQPLA